MPTETIAEKLVKLNQIKADLKTQIEAKGVTVGTADFEDYPGLVEDIPSGDGGTLTTKSITQNGTYSAQDDNADGYSEVTVNVPPTLFRKLIDKSITTVAADDLAGVTNIGTHAFHNCQSLTSITIPDSVTTIWDEAFNSCLSLTSIIIPNSVTRIRINAFIYCTRLSMVYITDLDAWCNMVIDSTASNPLSNNADLYLNGVLLTDLVIPSSITSIRYRAFSRCTSLTSVTIHGDVTSIADGAFLRCENLTKIIIHATTPPTLETSNVFNYTGDCPIYVPTPGTYRSETNWTAVVDSSSSSRIFPLVAIVADLNNIDTTTYAKACVIGADNSYKEYTWDGTQWNEVV